MKLGKLAECYPINNIRNGAILNLTFGDLYELINLITTVCTLLTKFHAIWSTWVSNERTYSKQYFET